MRFFRSRLTCFDGRAVESRFDLTLTFPSFGRRLLVISARWSFRFFRLFLRLRRADGVNVLAAEIRISFRLQFKLQASAAGAPPCVAAHFVNVGALRPERRHGDDKMIAFPFHQIARRPALTAFFAQHIFPTTLTCLCAHLFPPPFFDREARWRAHG